MPALTDFSSADLERRASSAVSDIAPVNLDLATFVGLWIETLLYGVFLVLFIGTIWALVFQRSTERVNRIMLGTAIVFLVSSTTHIGVNLARNMDAFINHPGNVSLYLSNITHPLNLAKVCIYGTQALVADALLIYRIYVVWGRNLYVIILPILLFIASAVSGYGGAYKMAGVIPGDNVYIAEVTTWLTSFFCITLATNIICTAILAYRVWSAQRKYSGGVGQRRLSDVLILVTESGAIYSTALILQIIFYILKSNVQYIILDPFSPLIGIVFSMIIIRVALGLTHGNSQNNKSAHGGQSHPLSTFQATSQHRSQAHNPVPPKPLTVNIKQSVRRSPDPTADLERSDSPFDDGKF